MWFCRKLLDLFSLPLTLLLHIIGRNRKWLGCKSPHSLQEWGWSGGYYKSFLFIMVSFSDICVEVEKEKLIRERYRGLLSAGGEPGESSGGWQSRIPQNMPLECKDYFWAKGPWKTGSKRALRPLILFQKAGDITPTWNQEERNILTIRGNSQGQENFVQTDLVKITLTFLQSVHILWLLDHTCLSLFDHIHKALRFGISLGL